MRMVSQPARLLYLSQKPTVERREAVPPPPLETVLQTRNPFIKRCQAVTQRLILRLHRWFRFGFRTVRLYRNLGS